MSRRPRPDLDGFYLSNELLENDRMIHWHKVDISCYVQSLCPIHAMCLLPHCYTPETALTFLQLSPLLKGDAFPLLQHTSIRPKQVLRALREPFISWLVY